ncbi:hypothetical protein M9980_02455 [Sphingomonas donggukensis]|uniref:Uncharacterized protein n=1 Tax=Sphingomonas donggukensis TaxID=2949093 RepID=A0ABY4TUU6_9SPHN|nr:hypothetical protein [Sphingomonas donggukensis]URW76113.1 hypothetical protein M9980_02455 [Sphingomonas donggukensis]
MRFLLAFWMVAISIYLLGRPSSADQVIHKVPFVGTLGITTLSVPDSRVYERASLSLRGGRGDYIKFELCPTIATDGRRAPGCEAIAALPVRDEIYVLIHAPRSRAKSPSISERPDVREPVPTALLPTPYDPRARRLKPADSDYALSRLSVLNPASIDTTEHGWPLVARDDGKSPFVTCIAAFAIKDVFVEALWQADRADAPDQLQAWRIAAVTDEMTRAIIK